MLTAQAAVLAMQRAGAALMAGDAAATRAALAALVERGPMTPQAWMMWGEAARLLDDGAAQEAAADALLADNPAQLRALIWKGDCRRAAGETRAASAYYRRALQLVSDGAPVPPSLAPLVEAAAAAQAALEADYAARLDAGLTARGQPPAARSARVRRTLAILQGAEADDMGIQRPSSLFVPDLPQRRYYERADFPWAAALEAETGAIRAELDAALADPGLFRPYLNHDASRPAMVAHELMDNADWSALHLVDNGRIAPDLAARFPATLAAMAEVPLCRISVRAPTIMFSLLKAGARIAPHHGAINARLICHLPLIVPGNGALKVGGEAREWRVGELLAFDDSVEHEAWNHADRDRVVLIFDVWRPELSADDRAGIAAIFETVDSTG